MSQLMYYYKHFTDVQLNVLQSDSVDKKEVVLHCDITGLHLDAITDAEVQFISSRYQNQNQYSCKNNRPTTTSTRSNGPYVVSTNNNTSCELHLSYSNPRNNGEYYCRVEVCTVDQTGCIYHDSRTVVVFISKQSDESNDDENSKGAVTITDVIMAAAIVLLAIIITAALILYGIRKLKCRRHRRERIRQQAEAGDRDWVEPALEHHLQQPQGADAMEEVRDNEEEQEGRIDIQQRRNRERFEESQKENEEMVQEQNENQPLLHVSDGEYA